MTDPAGVEAGPADPVWRVLHAACFAAMLTGGVLICGLTAVVVVSVVGRWLLSAPVPGDFEIVGMGTAVAVFLFLPYCHIQRGNVLVDLFLSRAPVRLQAACDVAADLLLGFIAGLLAWRLSLGGGDLLRYGETSLILGVPIWWAFPFAVAAMALLAVCCAYTALRTLLTRVR